MIDGDSARSESNVMVMASSDRGARIALVGHYWDTLRIVDGTWRFAKRKMRLS